MILSKSGTVNLEIALFKKPFVVIYKTSWLTWIIAKLMLGIRYISLVNILSNKEVVKEFIQHKARPENIAKEMHRLCTDKKYTDRMISELNNFTAGHIPNNSSPVTDQIARVILNA
jgi:lipid-A-disaccharide synthase